VARTHPFSGSGRLVQQLEGAVPKSSRDRDAATTARRTSRDKHLGALQFPGYLRNVEPFFAIASWSPPVNQQPVRTRPARRFRTAALLLVTLLATAGCESVVSGVVGVAGRYTLTHVNGIAVGAGYTIAGTNPVIVVQTGQIDFGGTNSGAYAVAISGTRGGVSQAVLADAGSFVYANNTLTFTSSVVPAPNNVYTGTISGSTLTLPVSAEPFGIGGSVTFTLTRQ
jgi:hypothetical protein